MTSYPTQYNFFVLAYYNSGASRTKYKGDDKATAVSVYEKASKQTNIDTVALYEGGKITRESNAERAQESSKKKSMSLSIGDLVKVIQTGEIVEIIHFEKNSEIILCRGNNSKRLTYTASELTRLSEADEISLVSEKESQKSIGVHKEIEQDFWSKAHKANTEERKDIVCLDGENLRELTVEKLTDITGIVSLNGKQIKVKLNKFHNVWYEIVEETKIIGVVALLGSTCLKELEITTSDHKIGIVHPSGQTRQVRFYADNKWYEEGMSGNVLPHVFNARKLEKKETVLFDDKTFQEMFVDKYTEEKGVVYVNGKTIKVKLNDFYHVWYQVDNFTQELPGVCIFQSFFKERVVLYSYELMALENQGLISSVYFIEEENRWIKIYSPLQKLTIYWDGIYDVTVVQTVDLDSVTIEQENTGRLVTLSFENLMRAEKNALNVIERETREKHVEKIQHVCFTLAQMNMFLSVHNVRDFCASIHGIHPREDLILVVLGKFILDRKLPETVGGLVAIKGSKYTRRIDVTTKDFMSGHIRLNGKIIPVRSYDGLGKWYELGMDKGKAMFILEAGKVL